MKLEYELLDSDKYKRARIVRLNKEAKSDTARNVKQINQAKNSKALKYIVGLLLIAGAIFITYKLLGGPVDGVAHKQNGQVMAMSQETANVEGAQASEKTVVDVVPVSNPKPEPAPTCASETMKYDWDVRIALAVMRAESHERAYVVNDNPATGDYSVGCFQVNIYGALAHGRPTEEELKNPVVNVAFAYHLLQRSSWSNSWGAYSSGVYLKYLQ